MGGPHFAESSAELVRDFAQPSQPGRRAPCEAARGLVRTTLSRMRVPFTARDLDLLISDKADEERDAVAAAWVAAGGQILTLGRFWEPPAVEPDRVRVYGNDSFCLVLAQKLDLELVSPADDLLLQLDPAMLGRSLRVVPFDALESIQFPAFVKPVVPKLFRAAVYPSAEALAAETAGLEADRQLLVSEVVHFENEVRCWILDGEVLSLSAYEGACDEASAHAFASGVAAHPALPETCVVDIGVVRDRGWAMIEANAAWGAGLNGCDPVAAARCIARACRKRT